MFDRYKDERRFDSAEAMFLARKLGAEFAESKRVIFHLVSRQLFEGYELGLSQPIDNTWRRLPSVTQLRHAAHEAYENALGRDHYEGKAALNGHIDGGLRTVFATKVPRLLMMFKDTALHPDLMAQIATELMTLRHDAVVATGKQKKGVVFGFTNYLADHRAEALHRTYLTNVSNGDICHALSVVADRTRKAAMQADHENLKDMLFDQAANLVKAARMFGGSDRPSTWTTLSAVETYAEEHIRTKRLAAMVMGAAA
jgi:hypothetical protein